MKKSIYLALTFLLFTAGINAQNFEENKITNSSEEEKSADAISKMGTIIENATKLKFYENAKEAGLTEDKTKELLKIIDERNKALKKLEILRNEASTSYSIEDPWSYFSFKIGETRKQYAKKIALLITSNIVVLLWIIIESKQ